MLTPKKIKYRKAFKGRLKGRAHVGDAFSFGEFALKATCCGKLTSQQIEAARIALNRTMKRGGKVLIRIFPDKPISKKPAETRMGSGKGNPEYWVAPIHPGRILYEISGTSEEVAVKALTLAGNKLPIETIVINRKSTL